ncbi:MAG: glycosyltransferase family 4 protein [Pseudomonadota bacterium]
MVTIAQIIPTLDEGGAERTTLEMTEAITARGWRAVVVTQGGRLTPRVDALGGTIITLPMASKNPLVMMRNARRLKTLVTDEKIDLFHARSRAPAWSTLWASRRTQIPFITTFHGAYGGGSRLKRQYNSIMVRADRVIANSHFTAEALVAGYGDLVPGLRPGLRERLTVIPRGVDLASFSPDAVTAARCDALLSQWYQEAKMDASQTRPFTIVMPARPSAWKGHAVALKALARMKTLMTGQAQTQAGQGRTFRLIFVGGDDGSTAFPSDKTSGGRAHKPGLATKNAEFGQALRRLAKDIGVADLVHFSGHETDMPAAYGAADAVIMPSTRPEAFGRVAVEAGAMGVPVVASDHGGARETVRHGKTGFLVPPGDSDALADALATLATMPAPARRALGAAAREHVTRHFSSASMTAATLAVYDAALGGGEAHTYPAPPADPYSGE